MENDDLKESAEAIKKDVHNILEIIKKKESIEEKTQKDKELEKLIYKYWLECVVGYNC